MVRLGVDWSASHDGGGVNAHDGERVVAMSRMVVVNNIIVEVWRYCFLLRSASCVRSRPPDRDLKMTCCAVMVSALCVVRGKSKWVSRVVMMYVKWQVEDTTFGLRPTSEWAGHPASWNPSNQRGRPIG